MPFKVPFFHRSTTVSDDPGDSYKVQLVSWGLLRYTTSQLSLDFYIDAGAGRISIERSSFSRINFSEAAKELSTEQQGHILNQIVAALEWRGWIVEVIP